MKRDESIERLLRSSGRSDAMRAGQGPCLDAETLAAWVDGGLTPGQVAQAESHVSACPRCQAVVAAMMASEPAGSAAASVPPARTWSLGWLVPLAAGVAAAGLWFMVPAGNPPGASPTGTTAPALFDRQIAAAPPTDSSQFRDAVPSVPHAPAAGAVTPVQGGLRRETPKTAAPAELKEEASAVGRTDELARRAQPEAAEKRAAEAAGQNAVASLEAAPQRAAPATPPAAAASAPAPASAPVSASAGRFATRSGDAAFIEIVSSDPAVRWRIGAGGSVLRSTNAGAAWESQASGVTANLAAGSSPSSDVCWLVGRAGTIVRTVDAGRVWQRVAFPDVVDLVAVRATTAAAAEVTAADGRVFRTTDAGASWR